MPTKMTDADLKVSDDTLYEMCLLWKNDTGVIGEFARACLRLLEEKATQIRFDCGGCGRPFYAEDESRDDVTRCAFCGCETLKVTP